MNDRSYKHIIGALLNDPQTNVPKAKGQQYHKYFPNKKEQTIYKGVLSVAEKSDNQVDTLTVAEEVSKGDQEMYMQVATYLAECQVACNASYLFETYVDQLKETHLREQLRKLSQFLQGKYADGTNEEMLAKMNHVLKYAQGLQDTRDLLTYKEIKDRYCETVYTDLSGEDTSQTMKYGITAMDEVGTPIRKTNMIVVGACPRMGKSILGVNLARNIIKQGKHVLFYSLEMDVEEIMDRYYAAYTTFPYHKIVNRKLSSDEFTELEAIAHREETQLTMKCEGMLTLDDIDRDLHILATKQPVDCVIVDYLQMMTDKDSKSIYESVTKLSNGLKRLAQKHGVALIALAQLNREGMKNRPELHHLAQSGAIEQAANVVWLLDKEDPKEMDSDPNKLFILLRKNRSGKGHADLATKIDYNKMLIT